jgi:arylformamidase
MMAAQPVPPLEQPSPSQPWIDVTVPIRPAMPVFPGEPNPELRPLKRIANGAKDNVSTITMSVHAGTHIDAPWHFIESGAKVHQLPVHNFSGRTLVIEIEHPEHIDVPEIRERWEDTTRVLFKTRNSDLWTNDSFRSDFVYVTPDAAQWIAQQRVILVGVDYLSVESFGSKDALTHKTLLKERIAILEGLDLSGIRGGWYEMLCLPLKIMDAEAAPARVLLRAKEAE